MVTVTVLSLLLQVGSFARLMLGYSFGATPLTSQYSGRHIWYWNSKEVYTEPFALGTTGKIQVGVAPGGNAAVMVPVCCVPVAAGGTLPKAPAGPMLLVLLLLLLLQAASAVMPAIAKAAIDRPGRAIFLISAPAPHQAGRRTSAPGPGCGPGRLSCPRPCMVESSLATFLLLGTHRSQASGYGPAPPAGARVISRAD